MDTSRLLAFAATAFVVIVIPGPSVLFVVVGRLQTGVASPSSACLATLAVNTCRSSPSRSALAPGRAVGRGVYSPEAARRLLSDLPRSQDLQASDGARGHFCGAARGELGPGLVLAGPRCWSHQSKTVIFLAAILPQFVSRNAGGVPEQSCCWACSLLGSRLPGRRVGARGWAAALVVCPVSAASSACGWRWGAWDCGGRTRLPIYRAQGLNPASRRAGSSCHVPPQLSSTRLGAGAAGGHALRPLLDRLIRQLEGGLGVSQHAAQDRDEDP